MFLLEISKDSNTSSQSFQTLREVAEAMRSDLLRNARLYDIDWFLVPTVDSIIDVFNENNGYEIRNIPQLPNYLLKQN